jgi:hypothetical protein
MTPKRNLASVAKELADGLEKGTVTLDGAGGERGTSPEPLAPGPGRLLVVLTLSVLLVAGLLAWDIYQRASP